SDVELLVLGQLFTGLGHDSVACHAGVLRVAGQGVGEGRLERGTVIFGLVLDAVEEPRGPSVFLDLELDLLDLLQVEEQVRVADGDALPVSLLGRRGTAEHRDDEESYSRSGVPGPSFPVHRTLPLRAKDAPHPFRHAAPRRGPPSRTRRTPGAGAGRSGP